MGEVQEALYRQGGYETILSHIHNAFTFDNEDEEMPHENAVICKWATYCLCCCLGDVLEPLEFVKAEVTNAVSIKLLARPQDTIGYQEMLLSKTIVNDDQQ